MFATEPSHGTWIFEIYMTGIGQWMPIEHGDEAVCREWYERQLELRPDLAPQCNLRNAAVNPEPPDPPDQVPEPSDG